MVVFPAESVTSSGALFTPAPIAARLFASFAIEIYLIAASINFVIVFVHFLSSYVCIRLVVATDQLFI